MTSAIIAIDGPAAVGKTTVGRQVADRLGWSYLDSGVLYRALTWQALQQGVPLDAVERLARLADDLDVLVRPASCADGRDADVLVDGRDVTWALRSPDVDRAVSLVAALAPVRRALITPQRRAVAEQAAVVTGRDIGTVIFPDAALKVFLVAAPGERARRRQAQLAAQGTALDQATVLADIERRDALDTDRASAPLVAAADAVHLDTEKRSIDALVDEIIRLWQERETTVGA